MLKYIPMLLFVCSCADAPDNKEPDTGTGIEIDTDTLPYGPYDTEIHEVMETFCKKMDYCDPRWVSVMGECNDLLYWKGIGDCKTYNPFWGRICMDEFATMDCDRVAEFLFTAIWPEECLNICN